MKYFSGGKYWEKIIPLDSEDCNIATARFCESSFGKTCANRLAANNAVSESQSANRPMINFIEELQMIPWSDNRHILNVNENSNLWRIRSYSTQAETKLLLIPIALLTLRYINLLQIKDTSLFV